MRRKSSKSLKSKRSSWARSAIRILAAKPNVSNRWQGRWHRPLPRWVVSARAQDGIERGCQLSRQTVDRHSDRLVLLLPAGTWISDRGRHLQRAAQESAKAGKGETQDEYEARKAELAAKNKSGKSTAKRQMPETDDEFQQRLTEWYSRPEAFHREFIYLSEDRLAMLQDEVWEITQQYLDARRRGKWLLNTSNCFSYQRPCEYLAYCQSGFSPNVADNLYEIALPNEELSRVDSEAPPF